MFSRITQAVLSSVKVGFCFGEAHHFLKWYGIIFHVKGRSFSKSENNFVICDRIMCRYFAEVTLI